MAPDRLSAELHVAERVAELEKLHAELKDLDDGRNWQKILNVVLTTCVVLIVLALVAVVFVVIGNRHLIGKIDQATGTDAQAAAAATVNGIKCDTRQALGETLAALGIDPPPLKEGCPPYTVVVAPHDGQPATPTPAPPPQSTAANAPQAQGSTVVLVPVSSTSPAPSEQQPTSPPPPSSEPEPTPEKPDTCALGVALFGCIVTANVNSGGGPVGALAAVLP